RSRTSASRRSRPRCRRSPKTACRATPPRPSSAPRSCSSRIDRVPYLLCLALLLVSCLPKPLPELPDPTRRQQKLFQASFDEVWKAAHATVEESLMRITEDDEAQGTLQAAMH